MGSDSALQTIRDDLAFLDDWDDRYRYLIDLGKAMAPLPAEAYSDANKVQGCASQVWLVSSAEEGPDPVVHFSGDSDAHIVRGLVAIVLAAYDGKRASEAAKLDATELFSKIGLVEHLSAQRANGLRSMIRRIREESARFV